MTSIAQFAPASAMQPLPENNQHRGGRHAVIVCNPDRHSFDHSIALRYAETVRIAGHDAVIRDLYAMGFDPVLKIDEQPSDQAFAPARDVARELQELAGCEVFVLVYPIWFGTPPAMLKGYIERVLGAGVRPQTVHEGGPTALLGHKTLLSFTTSATTNVWLDEQGQPMALRQVVDLYLVHAFGMRKQSHVSFDHITADMSDHFAQQYLLEVEEEAKRVCVEISALSNGAGRAQG
ncbi:NAD(P)H-dependent oxidoreductase [Sphingomonas sp. PAMC26645]|uniref:NAD(P)H-dependent oxidoreductase n=1 Tax=Sphingomonas sp. PAMC26645 TaxID=2565555 RepID=UPI001FF8B265|nr:NAD(P)H-dependent oxidoreductase [Sphingomonas sp. PAMC26645]